MAFINRLPHWRWLALWIGVLLLSTGCRKEAATSSSESAPGSEADSTAAAGELKTSAPIVAGVDDLYEDVTGKAGITFVHQFCDQRIANIIESNGAGAVIFDFDRDGWMDIFLVNSGPLEGVTHAPSGTVRQPNRLYRNRRDGTFEDVTDKAKVAGSGYGIAAAAADYDNDGYPDLYVVNVGKSVLYHNRGNGTFEDVTEKAGVAHTGTGIGAVFLDADHDGALDLLAANYLTYDPNYRLYFNPDAYPGPTSYKPEFNILYRNQGDGTFQDVSEQAGVRVPGHRAMSVCAFDFNGDGATDIYVCNDGTPNLLLVNDGKGHFQEQATQFWVAFNALGEAAGSMTAAVGDCNGDLIPDILVSRLGYGSLYMGSAQKTFTDQMLASGLGALTAQYVGWGTSFVDFDNDGDLDVLIANGDAHHLVGWKSLLLENDGAGKFSDAAAKGGTFFATEIRARGSYTLDFDNDGQMDLLVTTMGDRPFLLHHRGSSTNHWLTVDLEGTKSNRDGFGAIITATAAGKVQRAESRCPAGFLGQSDRRVHFGFGPSRVIERLDIHWPSGTHQVLEAVNADQILKVKEP